MREPSVGQPLAGWDADGGVYDMVSTPAALYTLSKVEGGRPSEFVISIVTTMMVLAGHRNEESQSPTNHRSDWSSSKFSLRKNEKKYR
jgi:hypothetical protein